MYTSLCWLPLKLDAALTTLPCAAALSRGIRFAARLAVAYFLWLDRHSKLWNIFVNSTVAYKEVSLFTAGNNQQCLPNNRRQVFSRFVKRENSHLNLPTQTASLLSNSVSLVPFEGFDYVLKERNRLVQFHQQNSCHHVYMLAGRLTGLCVTCPSCGHLPIARYNSGQ